MARPHWYGVRCVLRHPGLEDGGDHAYEERVTLWAAASSAEAIARAETEAGRYAGDVGATYLGLAQAYRCEDVPGDGAEVFSLLRTSALDPSRYLDELFDTGTERQGGSGAPVRDAR